MNSKQKEVQQTSLNDEKKVIQQLKQVYAQASKDCSSAIAALSARSDLQNLQSIIYQRQYQEAVKNQIDGILNTLQTNEFDSIASYLTTSYENGYVGAMYDLQGQGIPIISPIDQNQVAKAVQIDSKLSESMYKKLGEDVSYLKKSVKAEISRGIANGSTWVEMAEKIASGMNSPFNTAMYNSIRIARTEGHRVQQSAQLDALNEAKDEGADVVKQWDATLDDRTRPEHQELDGQIREIDEEFEVDGYSAMMPGGFGDPEMDINCRCCMLQRARWALDEDELKTLQDRAEYFGLDKTEDFNDYKEKYLSATYSVESSDPDSDNLVFQPASTIREAEDFARDTCGIENVSYKGCDVQVANAMNESLVNALNYCPALKDNINYYGSAQERNKALKSELTTYYTKYFTDYYTNLGYSAEQAATYGAKYGKQYASKMVGKISSNTYAVAYSGKCSSTAPEELQEIVSKYSGIGVNTAMAKSYDKMEASVQSDVSAKWYPIGCETVRSIFDHEFGHQLDYAYDLRSNKTIQQMYSSASEAEITAALSKYGSKNIAEYIAEAYSEYVNNPNARSTAKTIGSIVEGKVNGN